MGQGGDYCCKQLGLSSSRNQEPLIDYTAHTYKLSLLHEGGGIWVSVHHFLLSVTGWGLLLDMNSSALEDSTYANEQQDYILKHREQAFSSCLELSTGDLYGRLNGSRQSTEDNCLTCPFTVNFSPFPGLQPSPSFYSLLCGLSAYLSSHIHCKYSDLSSNTSVITSSVIMSYPAWLKPFDSLPCS